MSFAMVIEKLAELFDDEFDRTTFEFYKYRTMTLAAFGEGMLPVTVAELQLKVEKDPTDANRRLFVLAVASPAGVRNMTPEESVEFGSIHLEVTTLALKAKALVDGFSWRVEEVQAFQFNTPYNPGTPTLEACKELLHTKRFIDAIKLYRKEMDVGLKEGKAAIDKLRDEMLAKGELEES